MQKLIADALNVESSNLVNSEIVEVIPKSINIENTLNFDNNIEEDYEKSRSYIYRLMSKMDELIDLSITVSQQTEMPRAIEVAGGLIKVAVDATEQLAKLNKSTQLLKGVKPSAKASNITTNNSIFVGSTSDLSAFLNTKKHDDSTD